MWIIKSLCGGIFLTVLVMNKPGHFLFSHKTDRNISRKSLYWVKTNYSCGLSFYHQTSFFRSFFFRFFRFLRLRRKFPLQKTGIVWQNEAADYKFSNISRPSSFVPYKWFGSLRKKPKAFAQAHWGPCKTCLQRLSRQRRVTSGQSLSTSPLCVLVVRKVGSSASNRQVNTFWYRTFYDFKFMLYLTGFKLLIGEWSRKVSENWNHSRCFRKYTSKIYNCYCPWRIMMLKWFCFFARLLMQNVRECSVCWQKKYLKTRVQ